jgi:hypothetical protein
MDVPAFSLALLGLYFFSLFYRNQKNKFLVLFAICFAVGGLLKISSMISFIAITVLFFIELAGIKLKDQGKIFNSPVKQIFVFISVYSILFVWFLYARSYNEKYNAGNFLLGILPIWDFNQQQIHDMLKAVVENIKWAYFYRGTQLLFVLMLLFTLVNIKKVNKPLLILTALITIGFLGFLILFFQALAHDYYLTNMLILAPFILITFLLMLSTSYNKIFNSFIFRLFIVVFLIHNIDFARRRINDRYNPDGWQNAYYAKDIQVFEEIKPYLRSIGIKNNDRVISLSDKSINITLYLMNQKGWTDYGLNSDSTLIRQKIVMGAKYLFIFKREDYKQKSIQPFINNKIGTFRNVDIYKL